MTARQVLRAELRNTLRARPRTLAELQACHTNIESHVLTEELGKLTNDGSVLAVSGHYHLVPHTADVQPYSVSFDFEIDGELQRALARRYHLTDPEEIATVLRGLFQAALNDIRLLHLTARRRPLDTAT